MGAHKKILIIGVLALGMAGWTAVVAPEHVSARAKDLLLAIGWLSWAGAVLSLFWSRWVTRLMMKAQVSLIALTLMIVFVQLVFRCCPGLFPVHLRNMVEGAAIQDLRTAMVDYLPESPYAKPKADTRIQVPGYYGPTNTFAYEWQTDQLGFKNLPELAGCAHLPVVAVGDSFVEGMGVPLEQTWTTLLTQRGYPTYSLGVQGYAPSQMAGALCKYGLAFRPDWILVGYLSSVYLREEFFLQRPEDVVRAGRYPSAIGRLVYLDREMKKRYRLVVTALGVLVKTRWRSWTEAWWRPDDPRFIKMPAAAAGASPLAQALQRYRGETRKQVPATRAAAAIAAAPEWQSTERALDRILAGATGASARVAVLLFHHRGEVYYERLLGQSPPTNTSDRLEADLIRAWCAARGVPLVDTGPAFLDYVRALPATATAADLPYLLYDGHPSARGQELIAQTLLDFWAAQHYTCPPINTGALP